MHNYDNKYVHVAQICLWFVALMLYLTYIAKVIRLCDPNLSLFVLAICPRFHVTCLLTS